MAQVTIYLDADTERRVKSAAKSAKLSVSRWIAEVINEKTTDAWPQEFLDEAGAWPDFPDAEELRNNQPSDHRRESL